MLNRSPVETPYLRFYMIVSLVKSDSDSYRFDSRQVISELQDQQSCNIEFKRDPILHGMQNRIYTCRIGSIYINLILIEHEDPILQAFSFNLTCIDPILLNNYHVISDHNETRFYMACRIGSMYINLILIELEDTILQALGFDSICIDPILHGINHVISDPNEIRSYMACRIGSMYV